MSAWGLVMPSLTNHSQNPMKYTCHNLDELNRAAQALSEEITKGKQATHATVIGLSGELGSGKTTFTKAVAKELGVTHVVTSPTFVIQKKYTLSDDVPYKYLVHIDAYRLEKGADLDVLGWGDLIADPDTLIFLEWPEQVSDVLPPDLMTVTFTHINKTTRQVEW